MINTVIITTHNGYELTRSLIETLLLTLNPRQHEIVIVDDHSDDKTLELATRFRFIENKEGGLYRSWNLGIESARTEFVTVLNNDILFTQIDWWRWLHLALCTTKYELVAPFNHETYCFDEKGYARLTAAVSLTDLVTEDRYGDIHASAFSARKTLFAKLGGFDERFFIWYGEKDFEIRMIDKGVRYGTVKNVIARHLGSQTIKVSENESLLAPMTTVARKDYAAFVEKHESRDLEILGLSLKPFGPAALLG